MRRAAVRVLTYSWTHVSVIALGLGFWLLTEGLARGSLTYAADWAVHHGWHFALNAGLVFAVFLMILALCGRIGISFWLLAVLLVPFALANALKMHGYGFPLFPWELTLGTRVYTWIGLLKHLTWKMAITTAGFLLTAGLVLHFVPWYRRHLAYFERVLLAALAVLIWCSVYNGRPFALQHKAQVVLAQWDPVDMYDTNGFLLTSMLNAPLASVEKPAGYDKQAVTSLLGNRLNHAVTSPAALAGTTTEAIKAGDSTGGSKGSQSNPGTAANAGSGSTAYHDGVKPNIIVVLSEAFWDPTIVPGVTFSEDPVPTLHDLQKRYPGGWLQTPQFGGGTANVEFEALTGLSMRFLREDSLPYVQYVNRGVDSLASILSRQGYEATAINPLDNWFFVSREAYRNMGFRRYVSSEFFEPVKEGLFLADSEVAKTIIREAERSPGPDMIFANTMENHHPYYPGKFKENTINAEGSFPAGTKGIIETYAQGIHAADAMLKQLVNHYSTAPQPTMIVFFGDHLPALDTTEQKVYRNIGWVHGASDEEDPDYWRKMYRTPFVVWDNFLPQEPSAKPAELIMSPSFLGPYTLQRAGLAGTALTDYARTLARSVPVIPPRQHYADLGVNEEQLTGYRLLQYDALFGRRYAYAAQGIGGSIAAPEFRLGDSEPSIVSAAAELAGGDAAPGSVTLTVRGGGFAPQAAVYAGGAKLDTARVDASTMRAVLPGGPRPAAGKPLAVQVKLEDSKGFTLQTSNTVFVDVP